MTDHRDQERPEPLSAEERVDLHAEDEDTPVAIDRALARLDYVEGELERLQERLLDSASALEAAAAKLSVCQSDSLYNDTALAAARLAREAALSPEGSERD